MRRPLDGVVVVLGLLRRKRVQLPGHPAYPATVDTDDYVAPRHPDACAGAHDVLAVPPHRRELPPVAFEPIPPPPLPPYPAGCSPAHSIAKVPSAPPQRHT